MFGRLRLVLLYILGFPKSIYVNVRLLPFGQALKLPIIVSHKTRIKSLTGSVSFDKPKCAALKVGFGSTPTTDFRTDRNILFVKGKVVIHGKSRLGAGSKIHVHPNAVLEIGRDFNMTGRSTIVCKKRIVFGDHVLISWEVQIMDTDQHSIMNEQQKIINADTEITIGSDVWICSRVTILKGSTVSNGTVVASNALVSGQHQTENCILGGSPARVIKTGIRWN